MNIVSDDRPVILDDAVAALLDEYRVRDAIAAALGRWKETGRLQVEGDRSIERVLATHPIAPLRARFQAELSKAESVNAMKDNRATRAAVLRARERLELVEGRHAPIDEELHDEADAIAPVLKALDDAIDAIEKLEREAQGRGRAPWYRAHTGRYLPHLYSKPRRPGQGKWRPGDDAGNTRAEAIWFARGAADPVVALHIAKEVVARVRPIGSAVRRGQRVDVQLNQALSLLCSVEGGVDPKDAQKVLRAIGYPENRTTMPQLHRRLADLRKQRGFKQPPSKRGGRPRSVMATRTRTSTQRRKHI